MDNVDVLSIEREQQSYILITTKVLDTMRLQNHFSKSVAII